MLAGAVAAGQERRKYLAVIYKTLGATRARIIRAELLEFGLLGVATAALGGGARHAHRLGAVQMGVRGGVRVFAAGRGSRPCCSRCVFVLGIGAVATWRVLSAKAAPYLRAE